jgi:hypothetical protein
MNKKKIVTEIGNKRMLTTTEAETYTGLGKGLCRKWCESIGAVRKIGTRVLFDKTIIDQALDQLSQNSQTDIED